MMKMNRTILVAAVLAGIFAVAGCASKDSSGAEPAEAAMASIPSTSPLSKVTKGMAETDVRKILGEPTSSRSYMTGKQFIPWYFGSDTSRTAWTYAGQGQVIFSRNRYSGGLKVINVTYEPEIQ